MDIKRLKRIWKLKRLSQFSLESLVTDFGMYESALIDVRQIKIFDGDNHRIEVSPDVALLQDFLLNQNALLLPCCECQKELAFSPKNFYNPQNNILSDSGKKKQFYAPRRLATNLNGFSEIQGMETVLAKMHFTMESKVIATIAADDYALIQNRDVHELVCDRAVELIKSGLLRLYSEIRRDYICSLNPRHSVFIDFIIFDPLENDIPNACESLSAEDDQLYKSLKNCLVIKKVGQFPSLADLQLFDVEKYRTVLDKNSYHDLKMAIGLNADGVGCGAFLYLRRIFEKLVEEAHIKVKDSLPDWDESVYQNYHFDEKLKCLEKKDQVIIPEVLKEFKSQIYGVLSKGVHESSDDECMELFPHMLYIIEEILDERIRKREKEEKIKKLRETLRS